MKKIIMFIILFVMFGTINTITAKDKDDTMIKEAKRIIDEYLVKYEPLDVKYRNLFFDFSVTGNKKTSKQVSDLELAMRKLDSDPSRFAKLKALFKDRDKISDPLVRRQVEFLYYGHLTNQVSEDKLKKLTELNKVITEKFNDYRAVVDGKKLTPAEVDETLNKSTDIKLLEKVWKAKHLVGPQVEKEYRDLVRLKNEIARSLGYKNALVLNAEVQEFDLKKLDKIYEDITRFTDEPFKKLKDNFIDPRLAKRYGISVSELMPWHYQNAFFQAPPSAIFDEVNLDEFYKNTDANKLIKTTEHFFDSIGIDVKPLLKHSSLFPKPGKNPHAFAMFTDPNKPGSSVLLMNMPNPPKPVQAEDAGTFLHELAHDVNFEATLNNKELPYLLRELDGVLTEAFAMLLEDQTKTADWFKQLGVADDKAQATSKEVARIKYVDQIMFLRWSTVMYCFETSFYDNPEQDIQDRWWSCKERYQYVKRPPNWKNPDALAKYHIPNGSPLDYSYYAVGTLANVQFRDLLAKKLGRQELGSMFDARSLGDWLMKDFLAQGLKFSWDDFLVRYTGKSLSVDAWKKAYLDSKVAKSF